MQKFKAYLPTKRGSILVYSLTILFMMIAIVTTMSVATVIEKKSASSTDFSVQAYQTADSGVQLAIKKLNASSGKTISDVAVFPNCSNSNPDGTIIAGSDYKLSFFKDEAGTIPALCSEYVSVVRSIKSVGKYKDTVRAVQVAVAASGGGFGNWVGPNTYATHQSYRADEDGFAVGYSIDPGDSCRFFTDSNNPPTTVRAQGMTPVKKGDYWRAEGNCNNAKGPFWISINW